MIRPFYVDRPTLFYLFSSSTTVAVVGAVVSSVPFRYEGRFRPAMLKRSFNGGTDFHHTRYEVGRRGISLLSGVSIPYGYLVYLDVLHGFYLCAYQFG